jgi:hypothetical protein
MIFAMMSSATGDQATQPPPPTPPPTPPPLTDNSDTDKFDNENEDITDGIIGATMKTKFMADTEQEVEEERAAHVE